MLEYVEAYKLLKEELPEKRFIHTINVVDCAVNLARIYHIDVEMIKYAALLHDCAKYYSLEKKLNLCRQYNIAVSDVELANPELLHAKAGACLAKNKYQVTSDEIFNAIFYHTTGRPDMTKLEQIIFVSDYIEIGRTHSQKLPYLRELALTDIDKCTAIILEDTIEYLSKKNENDIDKIDKLTYDTYLFYKKYI